MSTPILDPSLPADNSPLSSGEMRGQFQAIASSLEGIRDRLTAVAPLGLTVSANRRPRMIHSSDVVCHGNGVANSAREDSLAASSCIYAMARNEYSRVDRHSEG